MLVFLTDAIFQIGGKIVTRIRISGISYDFLDLDQGLYSVFQAYLLLRI